MKNLLVVSFLLTFFLGCDTNENDLSRIFPVETVKVKNLSISGKQITVTTVHETPTPCVYFYFNEVTNDGTVFTSKVYGKYDGEPCLQVVSAFDYTEKFTFSSGGVKTLRFWQNDSTYLDTTITLQ